MLKIEIGGHMFLHSNAGELNQKVHEKLETVRGRLAEVERESQRLRKQQKAMIRFLGGAQASGPERPL